LEIKILYKNMTQLKIKNLENIQTIANDFIRLIGNHKIIAFYGGMGAGKTTFIKSLCKSLGSNDVVVSPTFAIVNEYLTSNSDSIFHFDMYRIDKIEDALNIGTLEYFESGSFCFIEWPEKIESILPETCLKVQIEETDNNERVIRF